MSESLWHRLGCYVTGHDYSVRSDQARIYLRCDSCGHRSDGWSLSTDPHLTRTVAHRPVDGERTRTVDGPRLAAP
jgi:hypothetical protein